VHQVKNHNYSYDAQAGGLGRLQLWGSQGKIAEVSFVDDTSSAPAPILSPDINSATVTIKRGALPGLIDMLRNESPVSVTINNQPPGFVFIHTGLEPVGEGEN